MSDEAPSIAGAPHQRATDKGFWCVIALRCSQAWDFIDARDIDKHAVMWATLGMTFYAVYWAMEFVWAHPDKPGLEVGAIVAAITLPLTTVLGRITDWYFRARQQSQEPIK